MNMEHRDQLAAALKSLSQRELALVLNDVLSSRDADIAAPACEEVKLVLAEAYRVRDSAGGRPAWELLVLASPAEEDAFVTDIAPTQEGSCCGVSLIGYAKNVMCPLCGQAAHLT